MKKTTIIQLIGIVLFFLCIATNLKSQHIDTECGGGCYVEPDYTTEITLKLPFATEETTITADIRDGIAYYQGDIILGELSDILQKGVGITAGLWTDGTMPYSISSDFSSSEISKIRNATTAISNATNLRMIPRTTEVNYINFITYTECASLVGMIGGAQPIGLAPGCIDYGTIVHEILHAAGIYHEQSRSDRDSYVVINWDNIEPGQERNFEIPTIGNPADYGTYDYNSIMHYGEYYYAIKNPDGTPVGPTITTIPAGIPIGQEDELSAGDIATVNAMYPAVDDNVSLCTYPTTSTPISISSIPDNLSGVTYNPLTNTLFMVTNGPLNIYETNLSGTILRTISLNGFDDTEGIVHIGGTEFAISDEETKRITFIDIFPTTTSITASNNYIQIPNDFGPWGHKSNKSLEGVSYNPTDGTIYVVKEGGFDSNLSEFIDKGFYAIERPTSLPATPTVADIDQLCNIAQNPYELGDLAGMHHLGLTFTGNTDVLLLSEASKTLVHLDENCNEIDRLSLNFINQPEGITVDNNGNIYIVGEPNQLVVLSPDLSLDADGDGICIPEDSCPNLDNNLIGMSCDDGDASTSDDVYTTDCECVGISIPPTCRQSDSLALIAVYNALNGNTWQEHLQWNFAQSMDTWSGVSLNGSGCVDKLDLAERTSMSGIIAPEIGDLSEVTSINLSKNNIDGIPSSIGNLTNLEYLNLDDNNLGGLPAAIGDLSSLKFLHLSHNNMGGISSVVGNLTNLKGLFLSHNNIGGINPAIGNLTNLERLYLDNNRIGGINAAVGNLSNLKYLFLSYNNIGGINPAIGNLTNLERLRLDNNNIGGLPSSIGDLTNLKYLFLQHNNLGGLPSELGKLANLERLQLNHNNIGGLPSAIGDLSKLQFLYLNYNRIVGINPNVGNLTNLIELHLDHNNIVGINPNVGKLTNLKRLYLNHNKIPGINPHVGDLANLIILHLHDNQISGSIPSWFGNLENLATLKLHNNNMSGCFSSELSSLCGQLTTASINLGNDFRIKWEDFCNGAACGSNKIEQNQAIDTQNFPNPFSNQTTITYTISEDSPVTLTVYDGAGRQVALLHDDEIKSAGTHSIHFEGGAYPAGMYYYTIQAGAYSGTQKMILMK